MASLRAVKRSSGSAIHLAATDRGEFITLSLPFKSLGAVSYSPSIITMAVSLAISEIFCVKEWHDLEMLVCVVQGH